MLLEHLPRVGELTLEGPIDKLKKVLGLSAPNRVAVDDPNATIKLASTLIDHLQEVFVPKRPITLFCIGTDRSTGDCLGPFVGTGFERLNLPGVTVYGTLDAPVHAGNLDEILQELPADEQEAIIAVDACLGKADNVGTISVRPGPLSPGTGVNKRLPQVGHLHIVGVVNVGGFMEYFVLQNTRLNLVVRLSELVIAGLRLALLQHFHLYSPAINEQDFGLLPFQDPRDKAIY